MFQQLPIFSDVAKYFAYPVLTRGSGANNVSITAAGGTGYGFVTLIPLNYFILTALRCVTNYDNVGAVVSTAAIAPVLPTAQFTPNNFTVEIKRGQNNVYSNSPMTQAEICSSGYLAGKIMPIPVIYGPEQNFLFTFTDLTQLFLLDGSSSAIPLNIQMFMAGYHVAVDKFNQFCEYFPSFAGVYTSAR